MRCQLPAISVQRTCFLNSSGSGYSFFTSSPMPYVLPSRSWFPATNRRSTLCPSGARSFGNTLRHAAAWNSISATCPVCAMSPRCRTASTLLSRKHRSAATSHLSDQYFVLYLPSAVVRRCVSLTTPNTRFALPGGVHPGGAAKSLAPNAAARPFRNPARVVRNSLAKSLFFMRGLYHNRVAYGSGMPRALFGAIWPRSSRHPSRPSECCRTSSPSNPSAERR